MRWLVEILSPNVYEVKKHNCSLVLRIDVNRGMFVSPDQIADLVRLNQVGIGRLSSFMLIGINRSQHTSMVMLMWKA